MQHDATSNLAWYFHGRFRIFQLRCLTTHLFRHLVHLNPAKSVHWKLGNIMKHMSSYIQKARICFHQVWPSMGTSSVKVWGGSWEQTTVWAQNQRGFGSDLKHDLCLLNNCWRINDWSLTCVSFSLTRELCQNMASFLGGFSGLSAKRSRSKWRLPRPPCQAQRVQKSLSMSQQKTNCRVLHGELPQVSDLAWKGIPSLAMFGLNVKST